MTGVPQPLEIRVSAGIHGVSVKYQCLSQGHLLFSKSVSESGARTALSFFRQCQRPVTRRHRISDPAVIFEGIRLSSSVYYLNR